MISKDLQVLYRQLQGSFVSYITDTQDSKFTAQYSDRTFKFQSLGEHVKR